MSGILEAEALAACAALDFETSSEDEESARAIRNREANNTLKRKNKGISDRKIPIRSKSTIQLLEGGEWYYIDRRVHQRYGPLTSTQMAYVWHKPIPVLGEHSMVFNREDKTNRTWTEVRIARDTSDLNRSIFPLLNETGHLLERLKKANPHQIWFYMDPSQNRVGPLDEEQMRHKFWEGEIDLRSFVWNRTMDRYARLEDTVMPEKSERINRLSFLYASFIFLPLTIFIKALSEPFSRIQKAARHSNL